jgi:FkbM family methyltransferase
VSDSLPLRFRAMSTFTRALKATGLREPVLQGRLRARRATRQAFERAGSQRLSAPALYGMDRKLDVIIDRDGGYYVEAGGNDGYAQSNTYLLERFRGWTGMLVEPMSALAAEARRNRPGARVVQCALVAPERSGEVIEMEFADLMSAVRGTKPEDWIQFGNQLGWRDPHVERVPARTLSELVDEAGVSDVTLLSLDIEGYELEALQGLDLTRHRPRWIVVEMHDLEAGRRDIGGYLADHYEEHSLLSPLDVLYRCTSG